MPPPAIGLIVTGAEALHDFQIFVKSLEVWHPDAELFIFTDSSTDLSKVKFKGVMNVKVALDAYKGLTRKAMEAMPGKLYDSLFKDYTYEKAAVLEWMMEAKPCIKDYGAWFMDADITHLAPLPHIPETATLALSPHYIRESDYRLFGKYNAGYFWIKDRALIDVWRAHAPASRFFEQAALEDLGAAVGDKLHEFPIQVNFGWWRMYQASAAPPDIQKKFSIFRQDRSVGLRYDGVPLQSIHTHWHERTSVTGAFNDWFNAFTAKFAVHAPLKQLRRTLGF